MTHTLKVTIPTLPKKYIENSSKGEQEMKIPVADNVKSPESTTPVSMTDQTRTVFTEEEEEKLKKLVTEHDFNMFMNAKEKAAKMVVRRWG